jgi:hypothetical protein
MSCSGDHGRLVEILYESPFPLAAKLRDENLQAVHREELPGRRLKLARIWDLP